MLVELTRSIDTTTVYVVPLRWADPVVLGDIDQKALWQSFTTRVKEVLKADDQPLAQGISGVCVLVYTVYERCGDESSRLGEVISLVVAPDKAIHGVLPQTWDVKLLSKEV